MSNGQDQVSDLEAQTSVREAHESPESYESLEDADAGWRRSSTNLAPIRPPNWRRRQSQQRDDLEPGAEYNLVLSKTPTRDPNYHDPAIWPDDLVKKSFPCLVATQWSSLTGCAG